MGVVSCTIGPVQTREVPPGKRPFARWHAQAQPGKLGLMLRAHKGEWRKFTPGTQKAHIPISIMYVPALVGTII